MARLSPDSLRSWLTGGWSLLRRPRSFRVTLVLLLLPLVLVSGALRSLIFTDHARRLIHRANEQLLAALAGEWAASLTLALNPALTEVQLDRFASLAPSGAIGQASAQLPAIVDLLEQAPNLAALFMANGHGELLLVSRPPAASPGQANQPKHRWVVATLRQQAGRIHSSQWLLQGGKRPIASPYPKPLLPADLDPRTRPWYQWARNRGQLVIGPVSRQARGGRLGLTLSHPLGQGQGVVGAAIAMGSLASALAQLQLPASTLLAVVDRQGVVLASSANLSRSVPDSPDPPQLGQVAKPALASLAAGLAQLERPAADTPSTKQAAANGSTADRPGSLSSSAIESSRIESSGIESSAIQTSKNPSSKNPSTGIQASSIQSLATRTSGNPSMAAGHGLGGPRFHQGQFAGQSWYQALVPLRSPLPHQPLYLAVAIPEADLMADALKQRWEIFLATFGVLVVSILVVLKLAGSLSRDLRRLARNASALRGFQFETGPRLHSLVSEVDDLSLTLDGMGRTIGHFLEISASLGAEPNVEALLASLLKESIGASSASAGALYLAPPPQAPKPGAGLQASQGEPDQHQSAGSKTNPGDDEGRPGDLGRGTPYPEKLGEGGQSQGSQSAGNAFEAALVMVGDQIADPQVLRPLSATDLGAMVDQGRCEPLLGALGPGAQGCIPMPLRQRDGTLLGVLVLWFRCDPDAHQIAFSRALSGSAAVALETRQLLAEQKRLFEAFIEVIAGAIDAKSPYTGGHCARVPEIAKLLAAAACGAKDWPFAAFSMDESQWEALHVAAWLHDCGKVTTPDHVVDKATKLETVHDRIHEIRMRFELLKSEAETDHWRRIATGADAEASQHELERSWRSLDDDFAFVAACNQGGEAMTADQVERLQAIATRTWRRSLDDRLGLGPDELRRRQGQSAPVLPVREPLLADRPDHRIERPKRDRIEAGNPWGFQMDVPEHLYNRGELHNLTVGRGTLSPEERFKINEHMIQTIRMLSALPFPRHLAAVPEIAGAHHESLDGRGYPRGLKAEQMGVLARVMAIADIFEALTAADRPYKRGLTLSQSLGIMGRMVREQHIDGDLFALFLRSGVYLRYAERHMDPAQIDPVDIEALLKSP